MEFSELMSALCQGALLTLEVFIIALPCALVLGIVITLAVRSRIAPLRWFFNAYIYVLRGTPLLLQMLFSDQEAVLYGILQVLIYTTILNRVLLMGNSRMQVKIISRQYQAINEAIATRLDRGATLLKARTGYLKEDGFVVMTVINSRELAHLNRLIQEIDPQAFIIINQVNEVRGRGFTLQKKDV